jgi:hypothetical protein
MAQEAEALAFCCRCKEDFPVAQEPSRWAMGVMRLLAKAPKGIREQFREWLDHPDGQYLCGNCYFDLTD